MGSFEDLTGKKFGRLTVVGRSDDTGNGKKPVTKWVCLCECGAVVHVKAYSLKSGHTVSCGCGKIKHHKANKERLYQTWKNMRQRCTNPRRPDYKRYGGKGVTICDEWNDYQAFRDWAMANGYTDEMSIDRIDPDGNYEPGNCRWVGMDVQANNTGRNRFIEFGGERKTMSEWADALGLSYSTMQHRIDRGWPMEKIVATPQRAW